MLSPTSETGEFVESDCLGGRGDAGLCGVSVGGFGADTRDVDLVEIRSGPGPIIAEEDRGGLHRLEARSQFAARRAVGQSLEVADRVGDQRSGAVPVAADLVILLGDLGDATTIVELVSVAGAVGCRDLLQLVRIGIVLERLADPAASDLVKRN